MSKQENLVQKVKRKIDKGFYLVQRYSYGIPYWRFEKGKQVSSYPRINEDAYCSLIPMLKNFKNVKDNIRYFKMKKIV